MERAKKGQEKADEGTGTSLAGIEQGAALRTRFLFAATKVTFHVG